VATTANISLAGTQTIDGVAVTVGQRVLVKDQSSAAANGLYLVASGSWTRTTDFDNWSEVPSAFVFIEAGSTNMNNGYVCTSIAGGTIGSTAITWSQFSGAGQITAGDGMTKSGNTLNVVTASSARIVVNANDIDLATTGVSANTYKSVTVDVYGRVTGGTNPTTLAGFGITDAYTKTYIDTLYGSTSSAAASAAAALVSENAAAASQSAAATSASNASTSETNASASAAAAAASYDSFDDRYLGAKSTAPTVDNDGNALLVGALYWNTGISALYAYDGANWAFYGSPDPAGTGVAMAIALG
jgi:phage-related tail fiber protein